MPGETDKFLAALEEIERGIAIMSKEPQPDHKRIEWWTREAATLREQLAREHLPSKPSE
jgi:hypothetical protein